MLTATLQSALARPFSRSASIKTARRSVVVVHASAEQPKTEGTGIYFFKGKSYSPAEWQQAVANGSVNVPAVTPDFSKEDGSGYMAAAAPASIGELMAFSGQAPELINGRLAMLAIVAALGAEFSSGEGVLRQLADEPTGVVLAAITFIAASLIPLLSSTKRESFAFFTPEAEMLNGRAAMMGFASLLIIEAVRGGAALF